MWFFLYLVTPYDYLPPLLMPVVVMVVVMVFIFIIVLLRGQIKGLIF